MIFQEEKALVVDVRSVRQFLGNKRFPLLENPSSLGVPEKCNLGTSKSQLEKISVSMGRSILLVHFETF